MILSSSQCQFIILTRGSETSEGTTFPLPYISPSFTCQTSSPSLAPPYASRTQPPLTRSLFSHLLPPPSSLPRVFLYLSMTAR